MLSCRKHVAKITEKTARRTRTGMTPLMIACQYGHRDLVKLFAKEFCDSELSTKKGTTALCFAAMHGHVKIVKYLLNAGANPNPDLDDGSPLLFACQEGRLLYTIFSKNNKLSN